MLWTKICKTPVWAQIWTVTKLWFDSQLASPHIRHAGSVYSFYCITGRFSDTLINVFAILVSALINTCFVPTFNIHNCNDMLLQANVHFLSFICVYLYTFNRYTCSDIATWQCLVYQLWCIHCTFIHLTDTLVVTLPLGNALLSTLMQILYLHTFNTYTCNATGQCPIFMIYTCPAPIHMTDTHAKLDVRITLSSQIMLYTCRHYLWILVLKQNRFIIQ